MTYPKLRLSATIEGDLTTLTNKRLDELVDEVCEVINAYEAVYDKLCEELNRRMFPELHENKEPTVEQLESFRKVRDEVYVKYAQEVLNASSEV